MLAQAFGVTALVEGILPEAVVAGVALLIAGQPGPSGPQAPPTGSSLLPSAPAPATAAGRAGLHRPTRQRSARAARPLPASRPSEQPRRYAFPVSGCTTSFAAEHHDYPATDIFADVGCDFVAVVDGVVDEVGRRDTWDCSSDRGADRGGLFVSVVGSDGVRFYGSHLRTVADEIAPGVQVEAGAVLGAVGETGSAAGTGSHLHFAIS